MADPAYEAMSKAKRQVEGGNPMGAEKTLEDYLVKDPHNTKPRLYLAQILVNNLNDKQTALMQLEIILDIEPDNMDALKAMVLMLRVDKRRKKDADEMYRKLLAHFPDDIDLMSSYAIFLRKQMVDFEGAAAYYEKALSINPRRSDIHYNYAIILVKDLKDYVAGREHLEEAIRLDPSNYNAQKGLDILMKKKFKDGKEKKGLFRK